ncbi:DUF6578 domain-containing protein [Streptomyces chryseus]
MALWRIMYDGWQMESCGEPFSVGDEVRWQLSLRRPEDLISPATWRDSFSEPAPVAGRGPVSGPGVTALYDGQPAAAPVAGLLRVETHGPRPHDVPATVGTVRSSRLVVAGYAETHAGSRAYEPVAGERWPRPVATCPKGFRDATRPDRDGRGRLPQETGVLVELETPGEPASVRPGQ